MGLDFNRNFSPKEQQILAFEEQLDIASQCNKPVFLHERDAFDTQLGILKNNPSLSGVAHCFTGNKSQLSAYLDLGLYIGITGWLCDPKRGTDLAEAAKYIPQDRLLIETDAPYLKPKNAPKRTADGVPSRRNEPALLPFVAEHLAHLRNATLEDIARTSYDNATILFNLGSLQTA